MKPAVERRRAERRPVLDTFAVFVVIPKKGMCRLKIHDMSELGLGFNLDVLREAHDDFSVRVGHSLDLRFYINQSLFLPLSVRVVRVDIQDGMHRVGAEFSEKNSPAYQAFLSFLQMLDRILEAVKISS